MIDTAASGLERRNGNNKKVTDGRLWLNHTFNITLSFFPSS